MFSFLNNDTNRAVKFVAPDSLFHEMFFFFMKQTDYAGFELRLGNFPYVDALL